MRPVVLASPSPTGGILSKLTDVLHQILGAVNFPTEAAKVAIREDIDALDEVVDEVVPEPATEAADAPKPFTG